MRYALALLAIACHKPADTGETAAETDTPPPTDTETGTETDTEGADLTDPIAPALGEVGTTPLDCTGAYTLPEEFTGADGLGHHGWTVDDLTFPLRWSFSNHFETQWISDNEDSATSMRVRPWLVPEGSTCYRDAIAAADGAAQPITEALSAMTAFAHHDTAYDALVRDTYTPPTYDFTGGHALYRALLGVHALDNPLPGAPSADGVDEAELLAAADAWPEPAQTALAELVLALGEATALQQTALADADADALDRIHQQFLDDWYGGLQDSFWSPYLGTVVEDLREHAGDVDLRASNAAALALAPRVDAALAALTATDPFAGGDLTLGTAWGDVILRSSDADDTWDDPDKALLIVDLGGDDAYTGRYASTSHRWQAASVLLDARGADAYGADTPDITSFDTPAYEAFDVKYGFTQGSALVGVAMLADASGDDSYAASVYAQGSAALGVGVLFDGDGTDTYQLGNHGQGAAFFGVGLLLDAHGDDHYGVYSVGQGVGKPRGHGTLLDLDGDDTYIAYYNAMDPWLPEPGYPNHFALDATWSYSESDGTPHYMSIAQGVGWGYRGDWFPDDMQNWAGGFGALVDLGEGDDVHYADDMSMGQGFVYGMGLLVDGGGDDLYRMFWWGMGAAAHMGVGVLLEEGGHDDMYSAWASAGFGYDCSVGWTLDHGGDDVRGGAWYAGYSYTYGQSFFIDAEGDDVYNVGGAQGAPAYGVVNWGFPGQKLAGVFLDLGGGADTYITPVDGVANDAAWYLEPTSNDADPEIHKGIGIDR